MQVKCPNCKGIASLLQSKDAKLSFECGSCKHTFARALPKSPPRPVKEKSEPAPPEVDPNKPVSHNVHVNSGPFVNYRNTGPITREWLQQNRQGPGWKM